MADESVAGQLAEQVAGSEQAAYSNAQSTQINPTNTNVSVRVLSPGDDGDVSQSNESGAVSFAGNTGDTTQAVDQSQGGTGGVGIQEAAQQADNSQWAESHADSTQVQPTNRNISVRVLSPGDGGSVSQANIATSNAEAGNANWTEQSAGQLQGGTLCCGSGIQAIGQLAKNHQAAIGLAATVQLGSLKQPCVCGKKDSVGNRNEPTRVKSPGDDGSVRQANVASSTSTAMNWNAVKQAAREIQPAPCVCRAPRIQAVGQLDTNDQFALSGALGFQHDPKNASAPERKKSPGKAGDVRQVGKELASDDVGNHAGSDRSAMRIQR
jgi:hypothetical protein